ncbi:MAG: hypothetical protein ACNS61_14185 [Candidatus Wenzhouxiangella sp. M2_3B_020]
MSADRLVSFVFVLTGVFLIFMAQFVAAATLDPIRDELGDAESIEKYNGKEHMDDIYRAVVVEVPTIAGVGLFVIAGWREYRRQRVTALAGGPR